MNKIIKGLGLAVFCYWQTSQGGVNEQLLVAAEKGNLTQVQRLLHKKADVGAKGMNDWTPLHLAAFNGHQKVAKLLIAHQADVGATEKNNWTPPAPRC